LNQKSIITHNLTRQFFFDGTGREDSLTEYINKNKVSENKENYKTKRKKSMRIKKVGLAILEFLGNKMLSLYGSTRQNPS
jgi:hypothetical protein